MCDFDSDIVCSTYLVLCISLLLLLQYLLLCVCMQLMIWKAKFIIYTDSVATNFTTTYILFMITLTFNQAAVFKSICQLLMN